MVQNIAMWVGLSGSLKRVKLISKYVAISAENFKYGCLKMTEWNLERLFALADESCGISAIRRADNKLVLIAGNKKATEYLEKCYQHYLRKVENES